MDAHTKIENARFRYVLDETQSPSKWRSARRRFMALERETYPLAIELLNVAETDDQIEAVLDQLRTQLKLAWWRNHQ